jgi:DNA-3-methyladenine glycosylase
MRTPPITRVATSTPATPILPESFYARDVVEVARDLLGRELVRDGVRLRITEVEAYAEHDTACHAHRGRTPRNAVMFGPGGRAYVYLCYGLHVMLNVVTGEDGSAAAVLVRSAEPIAGLDVVRARRGDREGPVLLTGPGKLGAALALDVAWSGHRLFEPGGLELHAGEPPRRILTGPRVGIDYASARDRRRAWRFAIADTRWISVPKSLRPVPSRARTH